MGCPGNGGARQNKRGNVNGWSASSVRRHIRWLWSVDVPALTGDGFGVTLTVRDTPADHGDWKKLREAFLQRLREAGCTRWHWVTEWQRRGTPHMHMAIYVPSGWLPPGSPTTDSAPTRAALIEAWFINTWCEVATDHQPGRAAQVVKPITGPEGWLRYLAKHSARGVRHYQRVGTPPGWTGTGRLWGHGGDWPTVEPVAGILDQEAYWRTRRLIRAWAIAQARSKGQWKRVAYLRRMLKNGDPALSAVRGSSEWCPGNVFIALAAAAGWDGELVEPATSATPAPC